MTFGGIKDMIKEIEEKFVEGNLKFKWKIMEGLESIEIEKDIPKYPILILTCMDPRIDVHRIFQLNPGDVFILRNAGNIYTIDMLRSILFAIVKYQIKYIIILGHLDCGMPKINLAELRMKLPSEFLSSLSRNYSDLLLRLRDFFKPFRNEIINIREQIKSLEKIKDFFPETEIIGMLYDVNTGLIFEYDIFKDYKIADNFKEKYKEMLIEKKVQFTDFLNKFESENVSFDDSKDLPQEDQLNEVEISNISNKNEENKDNSIITQEETKGYQYDNMQTFIPKIKVPKIQFHGVKIYIPKRFREKREIMN